MVDWCLSAQSVYAVLADFQSVVCTDMWLCRLLISVFLRVYNLKISDKQLK